MTINMNWSPVIGKLWRSKKGFLSGYLFSLGVIKEELENTGKEFNKVMPVCLWRNQHKQSSKDFDYAIRLITEPRPKAKEEPEEQTIDEMREEDLLFHEMEEAKEFPINF